MSEISHKKNRSNVHKSSSSGKGERSSVNKTSLSGRGERSSVNKSSSSNKRENTTHRKPQRHIINADMHKRSSRVYVLLIVLSVIMFMSLILDMTVAKTSDSINENIADAQIEAADENNSVETATEAVTETVTEEQIEITTRVLSDNEQAKIDEFYKNTVFVGDSIMLGFSTYVASNDVPQFLKNSTFLAAASYGVGAANKNQTLMYKGSSMTLLDCIKTINPDKIFINLGVNELNGVSAEKIGEKYHTLIDNIENTRPEAEIYVMGVTYFVEGKETSTYNNDGIREFNDYLESNADNWGVTYLDFASRLSNSKGYLPAELSSDNRIHHNNKAYLLWIQFLEDVALGNI